MILAVFIFSLAITGCDREEPVKPYRAPKELTLAELQKLESPTTPALGINPGMVPSPNPGEAASAAGSSSSPLDWKVPPGWQPQPNSSSMRYATFLVTGTDGQSADLSVVALGGGDVLANVNRWRGQLGLPAVKEEELPTVVTTIQLDGQNAVLVDIVGHSGADGDHASLTRMLAAIVPHADRTWFFKLTGPDALVASQKKTFVEFIQSVHFHDSPGSNGTTAEPSGG